MQASEIQSQTGYVGRGATSDKDIKHASVFNWQIYGTYVGYLPDQQLC